MGHSDSSLDLTAGLATVLRSLHVALGARPSRGDRLLHVHLGAFLSVSSRLAKDLVSVSRYLARKLRLMPARTLMFHPSGRMDLFDDTALLFGVVMSLGFE